VPAAAFASPVAGQSGAFRASWLLEQEARALLTRLDSVKPFVLQQTMVPAAALMPAAQVAIDRYLMRGRRELRAEVLAYLRWLAGPGRAAAPDAVQRRFVALKLRFNTALSQLDLFAEAISQRSEHQTGVWLAGLDIAAQDALVLPDRYYEVPPIVCHLHRGIGGAIRRARTRLPGGGDSPVSIIKIPRERMIGYGIGSSLVHETGHQGAELLDLLESLRASMQQARNGIPVARRAAWVLFERWISEIVADLWAIGKIGIASTLGLIGIVSLPRLFLFRVDPDDPHPFPWIRVHLSCAIGDAMYPHRQWKQLAESFNALYPTGGLRPEVVALLRSLLDTMPTFVQFLLTHRPKLLRGRTVGEVMRMPDRDPDRLLMQYAAWRDRPSLMYAAPPTLVFAVFGRARSAGRLTPEEESRQLRKLITHWALHSTLDVLGTCAVRWTHRPTTRSTTAPASTSGHTARLV